ncbi:MAG: Nicotinate-nucleotide pyrophosphorylase [Candidatus Magnetoglobus multicellularis str. Araruama]|uniref:Probable nicotinate-nucleotide pyrophosphorylase [carboxylating] n=1 Tax=Candidatus Magnetoglobus multicellularis str. Araruama TaxID=890399 RepID=A0A1V1PIM8_9BACT|nr:MAG: Nicotinate-nucleotide pyrophosphorylase [Candidatus Magnetoglobus multicellularis str. Araruama]
MEMLSFITKTVIQMALDEDIGSGDITTNAIIQSDEWGIAKIIAKQDLVVSGLEMVQYAYDCLSTGIFEFKAQCQEGDLVYSDQVICEIRSKLSTLLKGERTALNFLQRLSGIATNTREYVNLLHNRSKPIIVDTRKTTPGWRVMEKMAVRAGGAKNHRMGLYDGILIKDNHINICGGIIPAIERVRKHISHLIKIEVEVENFEQLADALSANADVIMLDNMSIDQIHQAVHIVKGKALLEVSGGVTMTHLEQLLDSGVDIISIGGLTHSAIAVDLSMEINNLSQ